MKKLFLLTALALFSLTISIAQVNFGAKAGVNFSDITGPDVDSFNGRTAFHVGFMAEIMFSDVFAVQPEIVYSAQGSDYEDPGDTGTAKVDFINIPIMAKYYVTEGLSLEAGPQVGILSSAKFEYDGGEEDFKEDLKGIDIGVNFGLGYKLENGLNFSARYNLGLTDMNDSEELDGGAEYKNSVIQISVGYFF